MVARPSLGAGMTIRKWAWDQLAANGFRCQLPCRQGARLSAGGDTELCFALRLAGWKLWYDPQIRIRHFVPISRLNWHYLRRLQRGFGASSVGFDAYTFAPVSDPGGWREKVRHTWEWQALSTLKQLVKRWRWVLRWVRPGHEGEEDMLWVEYQIGRLVELFRWRGRYNKSLKQVAYAAWRRPDARRAVPTESATALG